MTSTFPNVANICRKAALLHLKLLPIYIFFSFAVIVNYPAIVSYRLVDEAK